uniref:Putative secreted protein n=1 Tax=Ixodes ricinus TaxID=34613 RepID=A0A6B0URX8_IXORI
MEGLVSKVCGRLRFLPVAMAAAAATPTGPAAASCAVTSSATVEEERRSESSKGLSGLDGGSLRSSADIMEWLTTATFSVEFMSAEEFIPAGGPGWPTAVPGVSLSGSFRVRRNLCARVDQNDAGLSRRRGRNGI